MTTNVPFWKQTLQILPLGTQTLWPVSPPKTLPTYPRVLCDLASSSIVIHEGFTHAISPSWTVLSFIAHTFSPVSRPFQNKVLQPTLNLLLFWVFITTSYKPAPMYLLSPLTLNSPWRQDLSLSSFLLLTFHTVPEAKDLKRQEGTSKMRISFSFQPYWAESSFTDAKRGKQQVS